MTVIITISIVTAFEFPSFGCHENKFLRGLARKYKIMKYKIMEESEEQKNIGDDLANEDLEIESGLEDLPV